LKEKKMFVVKTIEGAEVVTVVQTLWMAIFTFEHSQNATYLLNLSKTAESLHKMASRTVRPRSRDTCQSPEIFLMLCVGRRKEIQSSRSWDRTEQG
jgi:hypothetical protein